MFRPQTSYHKYLVVQRKQSAVELLPINMMEYLYVNGAMESAMSKFTLIEALENPEPTKKTSNIKYQQYFVECETEEVEVLVPLRECDSFESSLETYDTTRLGLRALLRKHRAVREQ